MRNNMDGSASQFFYRSLDEFQQGFGTLDSLYWIGLDTLHDLSQRGCAVRFDFKDFDGTCYYAQYSTFLVGASADNYRLNIGGYEGNSRDSMTATHNNTQFSTYDRGPMQGCADYMIGGGWWFFSEYARPYECCSACLTNSYNPLYWYDPNDTSYLFMPEAVEVRFAC